MAEDPRKPTGPDRPEDAISRPKRERDRGVATRERSQVKRPPKFKVILYNDDYTPMEFVVSLLEQVFKRGPSEATQLMLTIHRTGSGCAGVYVLEVAETKVATVHRIAEERGYPLRAGAEPE
ncbi:MAG: ATP-dependent Clp protease adaptor ClpS [Myxococcota bacterium]|nr:ATP-dependent Clp protease adaptor ClpS [Myxococcota bacterium]